MEKPLQMAAFLVSGRAAANSKWSNLVSAEGGEAWLTVSRFGRRCFAGRVCWALQGTTPRRRAREVARFLRPGGIRVGYDLLENVGTRLLHRLGPGHGERLIDWQQLGPTFEALPFERVVLRRSRPLVRFKATRR